MKWSDLNLRTEGEDIVSGTLAVAKSKTDAGTGRLIPLTNRVCVELTFWRKRLQNPPPETYVFPQHSIGFAGAKRAAYIHNIDLNRPIGQWKKAWTLACKSAGVSYRWHDCRHTFINRLAENPQVSEETIRALAGHVSKKMPERYSHIRISAKQAAISSLEQALRELRETNR